MNKPILTILSTPDFDVHSSQFYIQVVNFRLINDEYHMKIITRAPKFPYVL
ncbi:hypothetical protein [Desulfitobacterium dichloroeliminans]|uniref:hypothetical protein n=1 Tax=Desulfitobacterium dichloroeliminans TaxID=233055 RepID=UPI0002E17293|nr:hypothetical protein [Desulfitobacterium dichloroeliminans]